MYIDIKGNKKKTYTILDLIIKHVDRFKVPNNIPMTYT